MSWTRAQWSSRNTPQAFETTFPATENPISQGGIWRNGLTNGLDWTDMQTSGGLAYGPANFLSSTYDDATAILARSWSPDARAEAVVKSINQQDGATTFQEVELRLRTSINGHVIKGYEFNWLCTHNGNQYHQVGYWYGPIGVQGGCALGCAFDAVPNSINSGGNGMTAAFGNPGLYDGDTVGAQIVGNHVTTWITHNGIVTPLQDFFDTGGAGGGAYFTAGQPGIGHWYHGSGGATSDFGFTKFRTVEVLN